MRIIIAVCLMLAPACLFAQNEGREDTIVLGGEIAPKDATKVYRLKNRLIAPKGEWQCGISLMYADFSSKNSELMLVLQGLDAMASMLRIAPEAAYTFKDNHAVGVRFQYTKISGMVDTATADLLGNLSLSVGNIGAMSYSMGGSVFQRTYLGLDNKGRVGIFWDYVLGYTRTKTEFNVGDPSGAYTLKNKISLNFAPGIVYFPMNNISVQACISLAGLSYNKVTAFEDGQLAGVRQAWKAHASLSLLDLSFGLTVHL